MSNNWICDQCSFLQIPILLVCSCKEAELQEHQDTGNVGRIQASLPHYSAHTIDEREEEGEDTFLHLSL